MFELMFVSFILFLFSSCMFFLYYTTCHCSYKYVTFSSKINKDTLKMLGVTFIHLFKCPVLPLKVSFASSCRLGELLVNFEENNKAKSSIGNIVGSTRN